MYFHLTPFLYQTLAFRPFVGTWTESKTEFTVFLLQLDSLLGLPVSYHGTSVRTSCSDQKANLGVLLTPPLSHLLHGEAAQFCAFCPRHDFPQPSVSPHLCEQDNANGHYLSGYYVCDMRLRAFHGLFHLASLTYLSRRSRIQSQYCLTPYTEPSQLLNSQMPEKSLELFCMVGTSYTHIKTDTAETSLHCKFSLHRR